MAIASPIWGTLATQTMLENEFDKAPATRPSMSVGISCYKKRSSFHALLPFNADKKLQCNTTFSNATLDLHSWSIWFLLEVNCMRRCWCCWGSRLSSLLSLCFPRENITGKLGLKTCCVVGDKHMFTL
jgi:hypothetical protein